MVPRGAAGRRPAEPRVISAFSFFSAFSPRDSLPQKLTNLSWISSTTAVFPTSTRKASRYSSPGTSTAVSRTALTRRQANSMPGKLFVWIDRHLDAARSGPLYLKQEPIAQLVIASIRYNAEQLPHYELHAFWVMANHVPPAGAAASKS